MYLKSNSSASIFTLTITLFLAASTATANDTVWSNVENLPDDLITTPDAWTAVRCDEFGRESHRIACDDFELTQPTKITSIVYYAVSFGPSDLDGHDWYIYEFGNTGEPGRLIASESDSIPNRQDTGWVNSVFNTPIYRNTMEPTDLVLDAGRYFLAFRSSVCLTDGKYSILSTRWDNGNANALWNFGVLADGTVTDRWMDMSEFNQIKEQEWSFTIQGEPANAGITLADPVPGSVGTSNQFNVSNATPNKRVYFAAALNTGETKIPGCPGLILNLANAQVIGRSDADNNGNASINRFVPNRFANTAIQFQALQPATCAVSNQLEFTFK